MSLCWLLLPWWGEVKVRIEERWWYRPLRMRWHLRLSSPNPALPPFRLRPYPRPDVIMTHRVKKNQIETKLDRGQDRSHSESLADQGRRMASVSRKP
jgi:hypothetical protein